jgi:hypothetical protein
MEGIAAGGYKRGGLQKFGVTAMGRVGIFTGGDKPTAYANLVNYSFGKGVAKTLAWIAITDIIPLGPPLEPGTRCMIFITDERLTFVGCVATDDADPTRFLATDVIDDNGNSVIG